MATLRDQFEAGRGEGSEVVSVDVLADPHPLAEFAGMFKNDPLFESWQESIAKYRREADDDPNYR